MVVVSHSRGRRDAQKESAPLSTFIVAVVCYRVLKIRIDRSFQKAAKTRDVSTRDDDSDAPSTLVSIDPKEEEEEDYNNAPLHDFGSNGSSDSTSSGVHPTERRIVGRSFPSTGMVPPRGAADDFEARPKMPADATTTPPSAT